MLTQSEIEARLLSQYFSCRPHYQKIIDIATVLIESKLIDLRHNKQPWERIDLRSRVKEFRSAVNKQRGEANMLAPSASFIKLNDMAALKIRVFPNDYLKPVQNIIKRLFPGAKPDHDPKQEQINADYSNVNRLKFFATLPKKYAIKTKFEIQIVPFVLDAFMDVQHDIVYKPDVKLPKLIPQLMIMPTEVVIPALRKWSKEVTKIIKDYGSKHH